ncbi:RhoGAP domain-containing protein, partial [Reticulomyxa filosa]
MLVRGTTAPQQRDSGQSDPKSRVQWDYLQTYEIAMQDFFDAVEERSVSFFFFPPLSDLFIVKIDVVLFPLPPSNFLCWEKKGISACDIHIDMDNMNTIQNKKNDENGDYSNEKQENIKLKVQIFKKKKNKHIHIHIYIFKKKRSELNDKAKTKLKAKEKEKEKEKERTKLNMKEQSKCKLTNESAKSEKLATPNSQLSQNNSTIVSLDIPKIVDWKDIDLGPRQESPAFAKAMMRVMENASESKTESENDNARSQTQTQIQIQTQLQLQTKGKPNANEEVAPTMKVAPPKKSATPTPKPETKKDVRSLPLSHSHDFVHQMDSLSASTLARKAMEANAALLGLPINSEEPLAMYHHPHQHPLSLSFSVPNNPF